MPRSFEMLSQDSPDITSTFVSKIKVRYLVEKFSPEAEAWVLMARMPVDSEPDQISNLCAALGGRVRVEDVTLHTYVIEKEFE